MVSFGRGGSGIGLMVSLTPSELVSTGPEDVPDDPELGDAVGSGIALMCSLGMAGGSSSLVTNRLLWCEW